MEKTEKTHTTVVPSEFDIQLKKFKEFEVQKPSNAKRPKKYDEFEYKIQPNMMVIPWVYEFNHDEYQGQHHLMGKTKHDLKSDNTDF